MQRSVAAWISMLALVAVWPAGASAQKLPAWMQVRASYAEREEPLTKLVLPTNEPALARRARRGAYMIAVGTGLMVAGVGSALVFSRRHSCNEQSLMRTPIVLGTMASISGLVLLIAGVARLKHLPPEGSAVSDGLLLPLTTAATGAVGFAANTLLTVPELIGCPLN